jgi:UDPglucose--hexose-1-phosphate uridylyltransferase
VRRDRLTGGQVVVAAHREGRPTGPTGQCPFCVGGVEAPEPFRTRSFPNRWPALGPGRCEVVLYSPDHEATFGRLGVDQVAEVVDLWAERTEVLGADPDIRYVLVFENRGAAVGATIEHPHGQIYAYDHVPPVPAAELERAAAEGCAVCAEVPGDRVVAEAGRWRAWVPHASAHPYGMVLAPTDHLGALPDLDPGSRRDLATLLVDVHGRLDGLWDAPMPAMSWFHQRPTDGARWPHAHLHLEIAVPLRGPGRMRHIAAGELGSGVLVNPVDPARAAAALREVTAPPSIH